MTANEQHFQRDSWLSLRHRSWGFNVPSMDIDFLIIEYDNLTPKALIDYKHENASINLNSAGTRTLAKLGDMAGIPAYVVVYGHDLYEKNALWSAPAPDAAHWFTVLALNALAVDLTRNMVKMSELQFVSWLYEIRLRKIPTDIAEQLKR